jgi:lycopene cyclase domain-containing protein
MTYFGFLLRFVILPILVMLIITWLDSRKNRPAAGFDIPRFPLILAVHVLLALVYTTPWDNYLVATGVWYYNPELVTGIVFGYVPIEEYTFFIVETIFSGLWWLFLARRLGLPGPETFRPSKKIVYGATGVLVAAWLFFTYQFFLGTREWTYLGITLFWALPAILPQFLFGADILWHHRKLVFWTTFPMGLYLSLTDIIALTETTWSISPSQTLGIKFFGVLPLEEVVFFFITNVLIGFGMTLMLSNLSQERLARWRARGFKGLP